MGLEIRGTCTRMVWLLFLEFDLGNYVFEIQNTNTNGYREHNRASSLNHMTSYKSSTILVTVNKNRLITVLCILNQIVVYSEPPEVPLRSAHAVNSKRFFFKNRHLCRRCLSPTKNRKTLRTYFTRIRVNEN